MRDTRLSPLVQEGRFFSAFLLRYLAFWLCYFLICRITFLSYHASLFGGVSLSTFAGIFAYGAYTDLSTACYIVVLPFLLWFLNSFLRLSFARRLVDGYTYCCVMLVAVITVCDLQIYRAWGTKLNAQALAYLRYPAEAAASVSSSPIGLLVLLAAALTAAGVFLYRRIFRGVALPAGAGVAAGISRIAVFPLCTAFIFLGIRGSVGVAPMNPSFAFFSEVTAANHAALNTCWNLVYDVKYYLRHQGKSFTYMSESEMRRRVDRIMRRDVPPETASVLSSARPNIIVVILESWTADVIAELGGEKGITPNFGKLTRDGLLFTDFYANGYRSSFGIPAVLGGYPSTPEGSILNRPLKMEKIPTLPAALKGAGYGTSFYYGGDKRFDDMSAFLMHARFDRVVDRDCFAAKDMNSKWGAHDGVVLDRMLADLKREQEPFFSAIFTLSSHEPFEVPMQKVYKGGGEPDLFRNAVHYCDGCIGDFLERARREGWYHNTLFVFVADHGHSLPLRRAKAYEPEHYRIPLLLYGDVLKREFRGQRNPETAAQSDIAATLLNQLRISHGEFEWSNDLFNKNRSNYAYYNLHTGFSFRTPQQTVAFDNVSKKVILARPLPVIETLRDGQAYLQYLYQKYQRY